jgi:hypothetical protein
MQLPKGLEDGAETSGIRALFRGILSHDSVLVSFPALATFEAKIVQNETRSF